jgi:AraC-like DNA-binding protein
MINMLDMGEVCLRPQHSPARLPDGAEYRPLPGGKKSREGRPKLNGLGEVADRARVVNGRSQREVKRNIAKALTYMSQNLDKPIQMATLGALAGVSMSQFYHLFKLVTGYTPNDFLIRARIRRACELLRETDLSIKEISAALGYDDQFYFSRVFKSVSLVSPREYRVMTVESEYTTKQRALEAFESRTFELLAPFPSEPKPNQPSSR